MNQGLEFQALCQMRATEKILIRIQLYALLPSWTEILDVRLHQRRILAKRLNLGVLLRDYFVNDLRFAWRSRLLTKCPRGRGGEPKNDT
jgi:hypothetical protein